MDLNHRRNQLLSIGATALLLVLLYLANTHGDNYEIRIINNCAIFIILAVSYNLINGVTGQFSLTIFDGNNVGGNINVLVRLMN